MTTQLRQQILSLGRTGDEVFGLVRIGAMMAAAVGILIAVLKL